MIKFENTEVMGWEAAVRGMRQMKKRKFRAMTNGEFCNKWRKNHLFCKSIVSDGYCCPISPTGNCFRDSFLNEPYIINGKYILIEVKK
nr:MAG TPA: hypothetical protein [Bacteriophage sp.]